MLKDRIELKEDGFQLYEDEKESGRSAYYTTFSLKDTQIRKTQTNRIEYQSLDSTLQEVNNKTFVCIWEMKEGEEVEEYSFYFTNGHAKPKLGWKIERARPYGDNAYMITIEWMNHVGEEIHKSHIYLKNKKTEKKFAFLKEVISPLDKTSRELRDQYIILLPEGVRAEDLVIEGDELLQQKYLLVKN